MISSILFDWGGTLDADGLHWLDRFYKIYDQVGLHEIPKPSIKEAFYWADAEAESDPAMKSADLHQMMDRHVHWQFQKLGLNDSNKEAEVAAAFTKPADRILHRNRHILEHLKYKGLRLGIISNFYGNIEALCKEFGYLPYLDVILDSAIVGLRKPDPKLYSLALEKLGTTADQVAFVGDSFERDIVPAKSVGMKTYWLIGDQRLTPPRPDQADSILLSLEDLPRDFKAIPQAV